MTVKVTAPHSYRSRPRNAEPATVQDSTTLGREGLRESAWGAIGDLRIVVVAPAAMATARVRPVTWTGVRLYGDALVAKIGCGGAELAAIVPAPGPDGGVAAESERMYLARGDGRDATEPFDAHGVARESVVPSPS